MEKHFLRETLKEIISNSTFHGVPRIIKTRKALMKTAWSLLILLAVYFCFTEIVNTIFDFLSFQTITSLETIVELPSLFPAITICNLNSFQTMLGLNMTKEVNKFTHEMNYSNLEKRLILMRWAAKMNNSIRKQLSFDLKSILLECSFNTEECNWSDFEWHFDYFYGNCFRFNSNKTKIKSISQTGNAFGLHLELFVGDPDSSPDFVTKSGYLIMIKNQSDFVSFNEGYEVATGFETNLEIRKHFTYKLGQPYSNCLNDLRTFDTEFYRNLIALNAVYRQSDCLTFCLGEILNKSCNSLSSNFSEAELQTSNKCRFNYTKYWLSKNFEESNCSKYCPHECNSQSYSVVSSFSQFSSLAYALEKMKYLTKQGILTEIMNMTAEKIKKSFLAVNVYYKDFSYSVVSQQPKTQLFDLISKIGGLLGLFVGMSLLSFGELLEISFELIIFFFK